MKKEKDAEKKIKDEHTQPKGTKEEQEELESLKAELKVLREEVATKDDYYDKFLRLQAEFDNFKKRVLKERSEFIKFANEGLILELVSILDDFERGIKSAEQKKDFELLHQGVDIISKQLHRLLEEKGLKRIKSVGEKFDPNQHEAVEVIEDQAEEETTVVEEFQPGYTLNDRVIRPARVKVVKKKQEEKVEVEEEKEQEKQEEG